jgi:hypothetical protein
MLGSCFQLNLVCPKSLFISDLLLIFLTSHIKFNAVQAALSRYSRMHQGIHRRHSTKSPAIQPYRDHNINQRFQRTME